MKDYKDLLSISMKAVSPVQYKNILRVWVKWDSNDADYVERTVEMDPNILFESKKLIYCLAYVTMPYSKGFKQSGPVFDHYISENTDIDNLGEILYNNEFGCYGCHSLEDISITYYDETGQPFKITFWEIHLRWKDMLYEDICKEINEAEL